MAEKTVSVRLAARVDAYVAAMKAAEKSTSNFSRATQRNLKNVGGNMQTIGRRMTTMITVPLALMAGGAVKAAVDWETAWAGVTKTVDGTATQMADLEEALRNMARELPATHGEIAAVAEAAGQLGVGVEDVEDFTRVMIDLGETTNLSADEAATTLARFMNIMGTGQDEVSNLGSTIVGLGNNFATTEREIAELATRLAAAAAQAGLSESDVLGFATALSSVGIEAEAGGTAFSRVFRTISIAVDTGNEDLETFARTAGLTADEFARAYREDASGAIADFIIGLGKLDPADAQRALKDLGLSGERVQRALFSAARDSGGLKDALRESEDAWEDNTALAEEANKRYDTAASRFKAVRDKVVDLGIDMGQMLLPAVEGVVGVIGRMAETFQDLPGPVQAAILGLGGVAAVAGPMVFVAGSLVKNLVAIRSSMKTLAGPARKASLAMGGLLLAVSVGVAIWQAFTSKQRELEQRTSDVSQALGAQWRDTLAVALASDGAEDAVTGLAAANLALSDALTASSEDGDKLKLALVELGRDPQQAFEDLLDVETRGAEALAEFAREAGATADQARILGEAVDSTDEQGEGLRRMIVGVALEMGLTRPAAEALSSSFLPLAEAMEEVQDQAEKVHLDEMAREALAAAASSAEASALIRQAMEDLQLDAIAGNETVIFQRFSELVAESDQVTQDAILSLDGYSEAVADIESEMAPAVAGMEDLTGAAENNEEAMVSAQDATESWASSFRESFEMTDRIASDVIFFLDEMTGSSLALEDAEEQLFEATHKMTDELGANSKSLDKSTRAGQENRNLLQDRVEAILGVTRRQIEQGKSQEEVTRTYSHNRTALLRHAKALGLDRDEVEELINEWGLMPDLVTTSYKMKQLDAARKEVEDFIIELGEIPEDIAADVEFHMFRGEYDEALGLLHGWSQESATASLRVSAPTLPRVVQDQGGQPVYQVTGSRWAFTAARMGGFFDRPTFPLLVGEAGREAVMPLTNNSRLKDLLSNPWSAPIWRAMGELTGAMGGMSGGSETVNVTVYNNGRDLTGDDIARAIVRHRVAA